MPVLAIGCGAYFLAFVVPSERSEWRDRHLADVPSEVEGSALRR